MEDGTEEEILRQLKWENRLLKERVFELEEKLKKAPPAPGQQGGGGRDSSVLKLLKSKDEALEKVAADLQRSISQLEEKNLELSLWMSTLRLYQEIFENEASAMIGVNGEGRIVLFNRTAPQLLGEKFRSMLHRPIEEADFGSFDPATAQMVRSTLQSRAPGRRALTVRNRRVETSTFPLGTDKEPAGVLVKIAVGPG